ncbi:MAG: hypothetical protein K8H88_09790 [Sandaracinaceae bacterium]|nr:hypothetical protein [Sandaracinaceae bacterium]
MDNVIEVAKTGRATCRTCRKKIEKATLRFGEAIVNQFDPDGGMTHVWHHLVCAAGRMPDKVKPVLETFEGEIPDRGEIDAALASGGGKKGGGGTSKAKRNFPYAERAPSGRSKCLECDENIEKDAWRIAIEREIDTGSFMTTGAGYLHPACAGDHVADDWDAIEQNSGLSESDYAALRAEAEG